jgi:acyl-coenzyme A synthetase/AMP-(fatty) acid ligase
VPHVVQTIGEIPRTGSGKIMRYKLRDLIKA